MNDDLFSELQDLGFEDIENFDLYNKVKKEEEKMKEADTSDEDKERSLLFDREVQCPVCETKFQVKAVKKEGFKVVKRDSDTFVYYESVNPYFYDVWICKRCGYAAMESDFNRIKSYQIEMVSDKITPKWQAKDYPEIYDVNIAIERYKLALLNYFYIDALPSKKAMTCLKLAWMYRLLNDDPKEKAFLKQSIEGFETAYYDEGFPIYNMDSFLVMYLVGELYRRTDNFDKALSWFSLLITTTSAPPKLKDKARDQRDLISEAQFAEKRKKLIEQSDNEITHIKKEPLFHKLFKKMGL